MYKWKQQDIKIHVMAAFLFLLKGVVKEWEYLEKRKMKLEKIEKILSAYALFCEYARAELK